MGSKALASTALLVSLNLLFFSLVSSAAPYCQSGSCPYNTLQLDVCLGVLGIQITPAHPCCTLIGNLVALDAAACLCTALQLQLPIVGTLDISASLQLLLNGCGCNLPSCTYPCP